MTGESNHNNADGPDVARERAGDKILRQFGRLTRHEQIILMILASLLGVIGGGSAIAFREAIDLFQWNFLGFATGGDISTIPWVRVMASTVGGGLLVGLCIRFLVPGRRIHSVSEVIEAATFHGGVIRFRAGLASAVVSALSLGAGASAGREGPVVHLGATISAFVARKLNLGRSLGRTLIGCGVAAAVAASFNAPIAGVFFALEVVIGHYTLRAFSPIVVASVTGTIVSRAYFGDFPAFAKLEYHVVSILEFPAFAMLGLASAITAVIFLRSIAIAQYAIRHSAVPEWLRPACAGIAVGLIALVFPQVLGVGYEATDQALNQQLGFAILAGLLVAKVAATAICIGFGFGGGVFSPSLFIGAMLGGAYGLVATSMFPDLSSGPGAYTIVGMGAVAGAVLGAPISTILMVFELTGDYSITVAVMIATAIASSVTKHFYGHSFFTWQLAKRGLDPSHGGEHQLLRSICVRDVMKQDFQSVPLDAPLRDVRDALLRSSHGELFVVDSDNVLHGTIVLSDLSDSAFDTSRDAALHAEDVARLHPPVLEPHVILEKAIDRMNAVHEQHIAVVRNETSMEVVEFVHQLDVMDAYNNAIKQAHAAERGED
ncbi:MAG: chloride channel protein [Alphaproteobacteria bacterium]